MKKNPLVLLLCALAFLFTVSWTASAQAWYLELTNVDGTLSGSGTYSMDLLFHGNTSDALNNVSVNVTYDPSKLTLNDINYDTWYGDDLGSSVLWTEGWLGFSHDPSAGSIDGVFSESPIGADPYHPMGTAYTAGGDAVTPANHLATLIFDQTVSGDFSDLAGFTLNRSASPTLITFADIGDITDDDLGIGKQGSSATMSPVPLPGGFWLLGSALALALGISRKKA
jgi:hypothetical protein